MGRMSCLFRGLCSLRALVYNESHPKCACLPIDNDTNSKWHLQSPDSPFDFTRVPLSNLVIY